IFLSQARHRRRRHGIPVTDPEQLHGRLSIILAINELEKIEKQPHAQYILMTFYLIYIQYVVGHSRVLAVKGPRAVTLRSECSTRTPSMAPPALTASELVHCHRNSRSAWTDRARR